jgi:UDP-N-acetyl-D-galactosamine dehydrogenase
MNNTAKTIQRVNIDQKRKSPVKYDMNLFHRLESNKAKLAVVGLGYVGLPIALEFANRYSVLGFDINEERVEMLNQHMDPSRELSKEKFKNKKIKYTHRLDRIEDAQFYVVAVPTPIDSLREPNLTPLKKATASVARVLKEGDCVVFESTVYPGCTEEVCVPILERISGLKLNEDFKVGYSPERINPGDKVNTVTTITKVVSGSDEEALDIIADVYSSIIKAGVHKASSIKVAEASKIIENTQRDVNIALMNELSVIFEKMNINTHEVLKAAGTKWNFLNFFPGLVGGHCIGVDPYYLAHKALELDVDPKVILSSRHINDSMALNIADRVISKLIDNGKSPHESNILVKGITFKENVSDIRNSKVADLVKKLRLMGANVTVEDPHAEPSEVSDEYNIQTVHKAEGSFDIVIIAVAHDKYNEEDQDYYRSISNQDTIFFDVRGTFEAQIPHGIYMSL